MQDGLVGAWEFVNMLLRDPEGRELELFEDAGTGRIVFAAEGQVSVQLRVTDSVNVYLKGDLFTTYYGP